MLTSYQTLLGGLTAVLCSTGVVSQNDSKGSSIVVVESSQIQPMEITYRGSGRLNEQPEDDDRTQSKSSFIAHRGSGRVQPESL